MQHLERLLSRLDNVSKHGNRHRARCPGHDDNNPSLDITMEDDGHILLKCCSAGCSTALILQSSGLTPDDLSPDSDEEFIYSDDQTVFDVPPVDSAPNGSALIEADIELRSTVYNAFILDLSLTEQHHDDLLHRGLHDSDIEERGYRSLTFDSGRDALVGLRTTFADTELLSVPGFVTDGNGGVRMAGPKEGLIIPSRDALGRIAALKVRRDNDHAEHGKYSCISGGGGPSCGVPTHVPLGIQLPVSVIRVTEGELKADIATVLSGIPTLGIAGVSNWRPALAVLQSFCVASVLLAFDADCKTKPHVTSCLSDFTTALIDAGFDVKIETWNIEDGKGIDDLFAAGKSPQVLVAHEATAFLSSILNSGVEPEISETTEVEIPPSSGSNPAEPDQLHTNKVLPFPLEIFPHSLQEFARQVATSVGCPIDLVAVPMLAVAATAIGASRAIEAKPGWQESARIYVATVAPPGSGKSPAETIVTRPVYRLQNKYQASHKKEKTAFETGEVVSPAPSIEVFDEYPDSELISVTQPVLDCQGPTSPHTDGSTCAAADDGTHIDPADEVLPSPDPDDPMSDMVPTLPQPTKPPELRRVLVGDVTTEALAKILAANPRGVLMARDEISSWLRGMNQYKGGKGTDRQFYLSCWSGQPALVDRKSQDEPVIIPRPFVNISGGIQPDMLPEFVDEKGRSDGFMDRIVFAYPEPAAPSLWSEQGVDWSVEQTWEELLDRLFQLPMEHNDEEDVFEPRVLTFTEDAKAVFRDWFNEHVAETESPDLPEALRGPWAKLKSYLLRFSLMMQLMQSASQGTEASYVGSNAVGRGIKLVDYFKSHARKVYASLIRDADDRRVEAVVNWLVRHDRECTARDLQRSGVAKIKKTSEASAMMKDMKDRGLGELVTRPNTQGKIVTSFVLNPGVSDSVG